MASAGHEVKTEGKAREALRPTNEVGNQSHNPGNVVSDSDDTEGEEDVRSADGGKSDGNDHGKHKKMKSNNINSIERRRERNRENSKRSRVRQKFIVDSLQQSITAVRDENTKLMQALREYLPDEAETVIASCTQIARSVLANETQSASQVLDDPDYGLVKALQTAEHNFVITDPTQTDNPVVYVSQGFLDLTGYRWDDVLGRNCRFLQGPRTDSRAVDKIRHGIAEMEDTTVVLLNYRADGSTFWNQMFISPLRDGAGMVVNYLGVQCKVSKAYATALLQHEVLDEAQKGKFT